MTRGWVIAALAVLLLAGAGVGGYLVWQDRQDSQLCVAAQTARDDLLDRPFEGGGPRAVLVVGDSYTQGTGIGGPAGAWSAQLAGLTGATVTVDGMSSTGYTTGGFCQGDAVTYGDRLAGHDLADDTTLIVQGSVNDGLTGEPGEVRSSADAALGEAEGAARIVVVGPPTIPALEAGVLQTIDEGLAAAAQAHDAVYVSLLAQAIPITDDGVHPTAEGQARIALLVADALR
jgi:lysophospholipase L1-like esterase